MSETLLVGLVAGLAALAGPALAAFVQRPAGGRALRNINHLAESTSKLDASTAGGQAMHGLLEAEVRAYDERRSKVRSQRLNRLNVWFTGGLALIVAGSSGTLAGWAMEATASSADFAVWLWIGASVVGGVGLIFLVAAVGTWYAPPAQQRSRA